MGFFFIEMKCHSWPRKGERGGGIRKKTKQKEGKELPVCSLVDLT